MNYQSDFILFGHGNYNTLGVLHELADGGINPLILSVGDPKDTANGNILGYSKFAKRVVIVENETKGIEWIKANSDEYPAGTIIYPTSDIAEMLLDEEFDSLFPHFRFPNAREKGAVSRLMDKHIQTELAKKAGIRILRSQYSNSSDFSFERVPFPCMVKPLNSTSGSKSDMKVCENISDLKTALIEAKHTQNFIIQQYIRNEADLLFLGLVLENGTVDIPAVVVKSGVSATGEYSHAIVSTDVRRYLPEIEEVKNFVRALRYSGPFSIEFGHEKGKNYFFEINLRNDGTSHYPLKAGLNIAMCYLTQRIPSQLPKTEYEMIDEVIDLRRVQRGEISFGKWLHSFRNAGTYRFYTAGDCGLIFPLVRMFFSHAIGKLFRKVKKSD